MKNKQYNLKRIAATSLLFLLALTSFHATAQQKSDLRVLVVAHNPDLEYTDNFSSAAPSEREATLAKKRGQEYKEFLEPRFEKVSLVYTDQYTSKMSDTYDVTIFDDLPKAIDSIDFGMYRSGKSIMRGGKPMMYARYLPEDFDRAVISVGGITDDLIYAIPSKFMTQCHCIIEGYGFNTREEHPIFNTPVKVNLEYEKVKTPRNFKKYFTGVDLPDEIDVWWAQTEDTSDKTGYWVGQIMMGLGFEDSPNAEYISGSNSIKDIDGLALGRSGNIFHWGFSASPAFMTDQAQQVFLNTIHYMAQFNGKPSTVPLYVSSSRLWANEWCYHQTGKILDLEKEFVPSGDQKKDSLYLFYKENYPYFYIYNQGFDFQVDEDAKQLGIPNNDPSILEAAVALLKDEAQAAMGLRLLHRYTDFRFQAHQEWKEWLNTYGEYLFFTETGGYKYMIDTYNNPHIKLPESNNKTTLRDEKNLIEKVRVTTTAENHEDEIVGVSARLLQKQDNYSVEINLDIKDGWHIYQEMPEDGIFLITKVEIETPTGIEKSGNMDHSAPLPYEAIEGTTIFKGKVSFVQKLEIDQDKLDEGVITCTIFHQACNDYVCHPPSELVLKLNPNALKI